MWGFGEENKMHISKNIINDQLYTPMEDKRSTIPRNFTGKIKTTFSMKTSLLHGFLKSKVSQISLFLSTKES